MTNPVPDIPAAIQAAEDFTEECKTYISNLRFVLGNNGVNMRSLVDAAENSMVMVGAIFKVMEKLGLPVQACINESHKQEPDFQKLIFEHFKYNEEEHNPVKINNKPH